MEAVLLDRLGRIAYDVHVADRKEADSLIGLDDAPKWKQLPELSREHWRKIAKAVLRASWDIDCGDLE